MTGAVATLHLRGSSASVLLRTPSGGLTQLAIGAAYPVVTRDGHSLAASSVRPGDSLAAQGNRVVDRSQRWLQVTGIVARAPSFSGDPMLVQLSSSRTIVVDVGKESQVSGGSGKGITLSTVQDSDQVRLSGALDNGLDEMTQTAALVWLGP